MQERIVYSKENRIVIRNDLMISNWALILYILYMLQIVKISPLPILLYATFVATTCVLIGIYYQNISANNFLAYVIMTFFLKIIPIYTIRNHKITKDNDENSSKREFQRKRRWRKKQDEKYNRKHRWNWFWWCSFSRNRSRINVSFWKQCKMPS
jgi:uncharacterized membrane protein